MAGVIHDVDRPLGAPQGARAIDRAAAILVDVVQADTGRPLAELATTAALPRSTAARLAATLERRGLLQRDGQGSFRPGPVLVGYARRGAGEADLVALAGPSLARLAARFGETVNLVLPAADGAATASQVDGRYLLGGTNWVGRTVPLHCSAGGKALLAFGAAELPSGRLARLGPHTITGRAELDREIEAVRARGWATIVDELEEGLAGAGAPVLARDGRATAAITVYGPRFRLTDERLAEVGAALVMEASALSVRLGHRHPEEAT